MGLREDKKAALRDRLHETASAMFRERGFDGTRIRDVIDEVGVSEATFFNYFPTKEALLHHSARQTKDFYGVFLVHLLARADEPAIARLHELSSTMAAVCAADRDLMATVLRRTSLFTGATGDDEATDKENYARLAELFRQGQAGGEIGSAHDPTQLAELFIAVHTLTITNWAIQYWDETGELEPRLAQALEVLLLGCS
jgi:AcrR family transcriptional regulator